MVARPASAAPASFPPRAAARGHSAGARPPGTTKPLSPVAAIPPMAETLPPQRTAHCAPRSVPGSEADGACGGGDASPLDAHSRTGSIAALRTHGGPPLQRPSGSAAADALCEKEKDHDAEKRSADAHPIDSATAGSEGPIPAAADRPTNAEAMPPHQPEEASGITAPATDGDPSWRVVLSFALGWILVVCVLAAIAIGGVAIILVTIGSVGAEWLKMSPEEEYGEKMTRKQRKKLRWKVWACGGRVTDALRDWLTRVARVCRRRPTSGPAERARTKNQRSEAKRSRPKPAAGRRVLRRQALARPSA